MAQSIAFVVVFAEKPTETDLEAIRENFEADLQEAWGQGIDYPQVKKVYVDDKYADLGD